MANVIYLVGQYANLLDGAESITPSNVDSLYPATNLYDELPGKPFRFSGGSDDKIDINANHVLNGNMETWTAGTTAIPDNWTVYTNPIAYLREGTIKTEGSYSCRLTEGGGNAIIIQDINALSGWAMTAHGSARSTDSGYAAEVRIRNLQTGNWLTSGGAWQAATAAIASDSTNNWDNSGDITFTVENFSTSGENHVCTLRVYCFRAGGSGGTYGYFDDIACWPHVNYVSIHHHNIRPTVTVKLQSDDNSSYSSVTLRATMTLANPSFYSKLGSTITERYWRVLFEGSENNVDPVEVGELVIGQYNTLARNMRGDPAPEIKFVQPQIRVVNELTGQTYAKSLTDFESRVLSFGYQALTTAQRDEIHEIYRRSQWGQHPIVIVPWDDESDVIYGRLANTIDYQRLNVKGELMPFWLEITEDPSAISVA